MTWLTISIAVHIFDTYNKIFRISFDLNANTINLDWLHIWLLFRLNKFQTFKLDHFRWLIIFKSLLSQQVNESLFLSCTFQTIHFYRNQIENVEKRKHTVSNWCSLPLSADLWPNKKKKTDSVFGLLQTEKWSVIERISFIYHNLCEILNISSFIVLVGCIFFPIRIFDNAHLQS